MIKMDRFLISQRPYAVDLHTLSKQHHSRFGGGYWDCRIDAVWFRRRSGVTVACIGYLWDFQDDEPNTSTEFLERHDDGRYGGTTLGRWDGERYWGSEVTLDEQARHLAILQPMLANYPEIPAGYDGWWRF